MARKGFLRKAAFLLKPKKNTKKQKLLIWAKCRNPKVNKGCSHQKRWSMLRP